MTDNIKYALTLLEMVGDDQEEAKALVAAAIALIQQDAGPDPVPAKPMVQEKEEKKTAQKKTATKKPGPKPGKKPIDTGKIVACRKGGRSIAWISDEMKCSEQTVRNKLKEQGIS